MIKFNTFYIPLSYFNICGFNPSGTFTVFSVNFEVFFEYGSIPTNHFSNWTRQFYENAQILFMIKIIWSTAHRLKHLYVEVPARYFSAIQDFFYHTDSDTAKFYITSRSPNLATLSLIWGFPRSGRLKIIYCFYYSSSREKLKSQ